MWQRVLPLEVGVPSEDLARCCRATAVATFEGLIGQAALPALDATRL
jgi:hypothetical protein